MWLMGTCSLRQSKRRWIFALARSPAADMNYARYADAVPTRRYSSTMKREYMSPGLRASRGRR